MKEERGEGRTRRSEKGKGERVREEGEVEGKKRREREGKESRIFKTHSPLGRSSPPPLTRGSSQSTLRRGWCQ